MKLRHIASACLLTLPLTCFATSVNLPILVSTAKPGNMNGWTVVDFSRIKPISQYAQKIWHVRCPYTIVGKGIVMVKPEFNGSLSHWSGRILDGSLEWKTGTHVESFVYTQIGNQIPRQLHFQIVSGDPVVIKMEYSCVAYS